MQRREIWGGNRGGSGGEVDYGAIWKEADCGVGAGIGFDCMKRSCTKIDILSLQHTAMR